jgi:hypothetical protein
MIAIMGAALSSPAHMALAQCGLNAACPGADLTRTASILVSHADLNTVPVEPDSGETWSITANYRLQTAGEPCDCDDRDDSVSVDVAWSDTSGWSATCTGCGGGSAIQGVAICGVGGCASGTITIDNSWSYELIVDLNNNHGFVCGATAMNARLVDVDFETTSVDDGDTIDTGNCSEDVAVSPTSQVFSATDAGPFECGFTCPAATGTSVTLTYQ